MAYITDGKVALALNKVSATSETTPGDQALANDMRRYVYVKASGTDIAADAVVKVTASFVASAQANGNFKTTVAVPANNYGWVYEINTGIQS